MNVSDKIKHHTIWASHNRDIIVCFECSASGVKKLTAYDGSTTIILCKQCQGSGRIVKNTITSRTCIEIDHPHYSSWSNEKTKYHNDTWIWYEPLVMTTEQFYDIK